VYCARLFFIAHRQITMTAPLIGLTTYRFLNKPGAQHNAIAEAYTQAVQNAGGIPVLIPLGLAETTLDDLLSRLDGILFTGGGDVQPERYGSHPHPLVDGIDLDRDQLEIHLLQSAVARDLPFLGICRGLQVINVALGGTLYEDILDQRPGGLRHQYGPEYPRNYLAHAIELRSEGRLAQALVETVSRVNSLHHQGVDRLAEGLLPTAWAPDGIVEAFELPAHPFGLAVQWHPEALQEHAPMRALFRAFVKAAAFVQAANG
jgi:putative glutamine amidotransferase